MNPLSPALSRRVRGATAPNLLLSHTFSPNCFPENAKDMQMHGSWRGFVVNGSFHRCWHSGQRSVVIITEHIHCVCVRQSSAPLSLLSIVLNSALNPHISARSTSQNNTFHFLVTTRAKCHTGCIIHPPSRECVLTSTWGPTRRAACSVCVLRQSSHAGDTYYFIILLFIECCWESSCFSLLTSTYCFCV